MFFSPSRRRATAASSPDLAEALKQTCAVIWFDGAGKVLDASDRFLALTGYARDQVVGRHHAMFMPRGQAETPDYAAHWQRLAAG
jgi:methyl-accepting chemotaxis protein